MLEQGILISAIIAVWGLWMKDRKTWRKDYKQLKYDHSIEKIRIEKRCWEDKKDLIRQMTEGNPTEEYISDMLKSYDDRIKEYNTRKIKKPPIEPTELGGFKKNAPDSDNGFRI